MKNKNFFRKIVCIVVALTLVLSSTFIYANTDIEFDDAYYEHMPIMSFGSPAEVGTLADLRQEILNAVGNGLTSIELIDDIEVTGSALIIPQNAEIVLIGNHTLTAMGTFWNLDPLIVILGDFTLDGPTLNRNLPPSGVTGDNTRGVYVYGGKFIMESGIIKNHRTGPFLANGGAGVRVGSRVDSNGTFIMNGGEISGNISSIGGGVFVDANGVFIMNGGEISDNRAWSSGGGVYIDNGTFTLNEGQIINNLNGGGVYIDNNSSFIMYGGAINGNSSTTHGGGVEVWRGSTFTMNGGEINNNEAAIHGGGVRIMPGSLFTMNAGKINGNTAGAGTDSVGGGGGLLIQGGTFIMYNGEIYNNTDKGTNGGGGVWVLSEGTVIIHNGEIVGNTADRGGGVAVMNSTFTMNNGEIRGNSATGSAGGGGIWVNAIATVNIGGNSSIIDNSAPNGNGGGIRTLAVANYDSLTSADYQNLTIANTVVFSGNAAAQAFAPPAIASSFTNIQFASSSIANPSGGYFHVINNYDINFAPTDGGVIDMISVTFAPGANGTLAGGTPNVVISVPHGTTLTATHIPAVTANTGWNHTGWSPANPVGAVITEPRTFTAQYTQPTNGGGGSGGGGGGTQPPAQQPPVAEVVPPEAPLTLPFIEDHFWYVRGFPDGSFRPEQSITRAEVAIILWRLLDSEAKYTQRASNFNDVSTGWYAQAVNYLTNRNVITGFPDGTFRPNAPITRAELTAIMSRFFDIEGDDENNFVDVSDTHWAILYINNATHRRWVIGFEDNTFRPNNATTRAEVVTLMNRVYKRTPNADTINYHLEYSLYELIGDNRLFIDVTNAHWAFYDIMEAAIEHSYEWDDFGREIWTSISIPWLW